MSDARPLRVLMVAARYLPDLGGIETHIHEIGTLLAARNDIDLTVVATDVTGRRPRREEVDGFTLLRCRAWPRHRDYYFAPGIARLIRRGTWDLIHFQGVHTLVPPLGMLAARMTGTPYVLTFHTGGHSSSLRENSRSLQWRLLTPLLRSARKLIAVGRFERRQFEAATAINPDRFAVIRNGGALPEPATEEQPIPGRIVSSGRLERYKGHHRVVAALAALRTTHPEAHLVVLGAGPYESSILECAAELGVSDAVTIRLVPSDGRQAMARELAQAATFAAFSDYEAHPVAVMEAVAAGVPVVGYDVAGIGDLVEDGLVTGLPVGAPPEQAAIALAEAMAQNPSGPHRPVHGLPTWELAADQLAAVYFEAVTPTPSQAATGARPRVVHIVPAMSEGGGERLIGYLLDDPAVAGSVICLYERGALGAAASEQGYQIDVLGMATGWRRPATVIRLARLLRQRKPDVVHLHLLSGQLWGAPAAKLAGIPVVVSSEHSLMDATIEGRPLSRRLRQVYLLLQRLTTRTVAVSDRTAQRLRAWGVPAKKITVIDNGIDFDAVKYSAKGRERVRKELLLSEETLLVGVVGRLEKVKRVEVAIRTVAALDNDVHVLVVGGGSQRDALAQLASDLDVADRVHLIGPRSDIPDLLSAVDLLLSPSRDETFGMAIIEALGSGLPVVYEQCPALDELPIAVPSAQKIEDTLGPDEEIARLAAAVLDAARQPRSRELVPAALIARYGLNRMRVALANLYHELLIANDRGRAR